MATLLLFGPARTAAGCGRVTIDAGSVRALCEEAVRRFGPDFERVLAGAAVWVNGDQAQDATPIGEGDEVAVVPPVSGGA